MNSIFIAYQRPHSEGTVSSPGNLTMKSSKANISEIVRNGRFIDDINPFEMKLCRGNRTYLLIKVFNKAEIKIELRRL